MAAGDITYSYDLEAQSVAGGQKFKEKRSSVAGTMRAGLAPLHTIQTIGGTAEAIVIGEVSAPFLLFARNVNASGLFIALRPDSADADFAQLSVSEIADCIVPCHSNINLFAIAPSGSPNLQYMVIPV